MAFDLTRLTGAGCTLGPDGFATQRARVQRLREHVATVDEEGDVLRVAFDPGVEPSLVRDFVETEGVCCRFLSLGYDGGERVLRIRSADESGVDVVRGFTAVFSGRPA